MRTVRVWWCQADMAISNKDVPTGNGTTGQIKQSSRDKSLTRNYGEL